MNISYLLDGVVGTFDEPVDYPKLFEGFADDVEGPVRIPSLAGAQDSPLNIGRED